VAFRLIIISGKEEGTEYIFTQQARIGRGPENEVRLPDKGISRHHARIYLRNEQFFVQDLGSANGTRVNGSLTRGEQKLSGADSLRLGPVVLAFRVLEGPGDIRESDTQLLSEQGVTGIRRTASNPGGIPTKIVDARVAAAASGAASAEDIEPTKSRIENPRTLGGQLMELWDGMTPRRRRKVLTLSSLAAAALLVLGVWLAVPEKTQALPVAGPEPEVLTSEPTPGGFGLGPGVTWLRPDEKRFVFELAAPTRMVGILHFNAHDVDAGEVVVSLNGELQGELVGDYAGSGAEQVLRAQVLRPNGRNELVLENVRNPPGKETWEVSDVRLELIPVPDLPPVELVGEATELVDSAKAWETQKSVAPENAFRAWKSYRQAWLTLEALDVRPTLHGEVKDRMDALRRELDQSCSGLMVRAHRAMELRETGEAREALQDVLRYFPTTEHPCHNRALRLLATQGTPPR